MGIMRIRYCGLGGGYWVFRYWGRNLLIQSLRFSTAQALEQLNLVSIMIVFRGTSPSSMMSVMPSCLAIFIFVG